jgi:hypothetical protein
MHPPTSGLLPTALRFHRPYKPLVRLLRYVTTKCPEPLRLRVGITSSQHRIRTRVGRHYPAFLAPTGSCAGPRPSSCLGSNLVHKVFAGCCQPLLGIGPSRRYLCESFLTCLDPYPGCSCGALTRFFPQDNGLPNVRTRSARSLSRPWHIPVQQFQYGALYEAAVIHSCSGPWVCSPPRLLLPQRIVIPVSFIGP